MSAPGGGGGCPLCRVLAVARGEYPDATAALAAAGSALSAAVGELLRAPVRPAARPPYGSADTAPGSAVRVQHIEVRPG